MGFYGETILPKLCDLAMRNKDLVPYRERVIGAAEGRVVEIGVGSGRNLPFYRSPVKQVSALEPASNLIAMARRAQHPNTPVDFITGSAGHSARQPLRRYCRDHLDVMQHSTSRHGAGRDAPGASAWRQALVR